MVVQATEALQILAVVGVVDEGSEGASVGETGRVRWAVLIVGNGVFRGG